jgi:hypothetical protein
MNTPAPKDRRALRDVENTLRRYDRRFYRRDSLKGASTAELVTLWRDLRRARHDFQTALPDSSRAARLLEQTL